MKNYIIPLVFLFILAACGSNQQAENQQEQGQETTADMDFSKEGQQEVADNKDVQELTVSESVSPAERDEKYYFNQGTSNFGKGNYKAGIAICAKRQVGFYYIASCF